MKKNQGQSNEIEISEHSKLIGEETKSNVSAHKTQSNKKIIPEIDKTKAANHSNNNPIYGWVSHLKNELRTIVEDDKSYINPLREDTELNDLLVELRRLKKDVGFEEKNGRLHTFNKALNKLEDEIEFKVISKAERIDQIDGYSSIEQRTDLVSKFQDEQQIFIDKVKKEIKTSEAALLKETQKAFYESLKNIIIHPIWELQVRRYGGEIIAKEENLKTRVPTGIEKMLRIILKLPVPKKKYCCCFSFFCKPAPVSRVSVKTGEEESLESNEIIQNIIDIKEIARNRLIMNSRRREPTNLFYTALQSININRLQDFKTVNEYVSKFENVNGKNSVMYFMVAEEQVEPKRSKLSLQHV